MSDLGQKALCVRENHLSNERSYQETKSKHPKWLVIENISI